MHVYIYICIYIYYLKKKKKTIYKRTIVLKMGSATPQTEDPAAAQPEALRMPRLSQQLQQLHGLAQLRVITAFVRSPGGDLSPPEKMSGSSGRLAVIQTSHSSPTKPPPAVGRNEETVTSKQSCRSSDGWG